MSDAHSFTSRLTQTAYSDTSQREREKEKEWMNEIKFNMRDELLVHIQAHNNAHTRAAFGKPQTVEFEKLKSEYKIEHGHENGLMI